MKQKHMETIKNIQNIQKTYKIDIWENSGKHIEPKYNGKHNIRKIPKNCLPEHAAWSLWCSRSCLCSLHGEGCQPGLSLLQALPQGFLWRNLLWWGWIPTICQAKQWAHFTKRLSQSHTHVFTNQDVVPYNPYLLAKYDCHINVEISASVKAVKYIHKYVYKGHDRATVQIGNVDEIQDYIDGHYIGPVEACWHLFEFPMHQELPSVYHLPVHLQNEQQVYFQDNDDPQDVLDRSSAKKTHLTEWFKANQEYPATACQHL